MNNNMEMTASDQSAWFRHWFDSSFYQQLYGHRNEEEAAAFIDELITVLDPSPGSAMLDLGCGSGRHSKYLAAQGFNVTGLDLSSTGIRQAKKWECSHLRFGRHDMREPFGKNRFNYVFNFFTSFGYFNEVENQKVIHNIFNSLLPGGTLVLDYFNSNYAEQKLVPREEKEIDGIIYRIEKWNDSRHFFKKIVIDDLSANGIKQFTEKVAIYNVHDLESMFNAHGLRLQNVYGDYHLNEFDINTSPRLILVVKKHKR